MNIALWIIQVLLALHTAAGAVWKFTNSEQSVPSLQMIPHGVWLGLSVFEIICALGLVLPGFIKPVAYLIPIAAGCIAAEMLVFSGLHLSSGIKEHGQMIYWLVVAAISGFVVYGRS